MATASQLNGQYDVDKTTAKATSIIHDDILDSGREYLGKAKDLSIQMVDRTTGLVKQNPGYAILGAATVGFLAGAYFFRRK